MSQDTPNPGLDNESLIDGSAAAEAKRRAARRRFLGQSAATGSGLVVVTLFHTRAFARQPTTQNGTTTHLVSSIEACNSWAGAAGGRLETNGGGNLKIYASPSGQTRYNCIKN